MTFGDAIRTCISKATTWQGRAARSEYWYFFLFGFLVLIAATVLDSILGTSFKVTDPNSGQQISLGYGWLYLLTALAFMLPNIAVMVRRLHDTGRSGWWYWIALVPLIGAIMLLIWFCSRGTVGSNEYGPDPLGGGEAATFS